MQARQRRSRGAGRTAATAGLLLAGALLSSCGTPPGPTSSGGDGPTPAAAHPTAVETRVAGPNHTPGGTSAAVPHVVPSPSDLTWGPVTFRACDRQAPPAGATHLRPHTFTAAERAAGIDGMPLPEGRLVVESAGDLDLPDGQLGAGNGYEAATASGPAASVVDGSVTAKVSLAVLDSPTVGRRVAFVEVQLDDEPVALWTQSPKLGISTDGGDGGFYSAAAPVTQDDGDGRFINTYVEAFFPGNDDDSGIVCVLRRPTHGDRTDAVMFGIGYGDGGYPVLLGHAEDGRIVSVVTTGFVVPWALSGLPGTPPELDES